MKGAMKKGILISSQPLFTLLSFGSGVRVQGSRFRVQGSRGGFAAFFLEDGILVSQPSPLGEGAPQGRIG